MNILQVENVTKNYGEKTAVDSIELQLKKGQIFGLLGANGAGKTTTMRMVLGLIYPDSGRILWKGKGYSDELRRIMGYLPEERGLYPKIKVSDQILYLAELHGINKSEAVTNLKIWLERFNVPEYYNKKVEELSKGNQQKIQFIAAVIHKPDILILDEAFSGLDPVNVELLKETVKNLRDEGTTILFSTHRMEHIEELCQEICILHNSKTVLQGNIKAIKKTLPKERVILETADPVNAIESIPGVISVKHSESGYEIRISPNEPTAAAKILEKAMSQSAVNRFQIMEPTLNEIFIKSVGGQFE